MTQYNMEHGDDVPAGHLDFLDLQITASILLENLTPASNYLFEMPFASTVQIWDSPPMPTSTLVGLTESALAGNSASATATAGAPTMTKTLSRPRQNALSSKERPSLDLIEGR
ncbi:hypothetical protein BC830DRAFT_1173151 [Chytriomyces sp. MP71]|nr:hypothetical protein BC830DRAFT_1173151 [Chytriomyces sp. MP71]